MNLARVFAEKPQIGWVAMVGVLIWGGVSYVKMPQRKDPEIKIKTAVVSTVWPGASAEDEVVLPDANVIVNPNQPGDEFPSKSLAGVGVMFYVLLALRAELRARGLARAAQFSWERCAEATLRVLRG